MNKYMHTTFMRRILALYRLQSSAVRLCAGSRLKRHLSKTNMMHACFSSFGLLFSFLFPLAINSECIFFALAIIIEDDRLPMSC